MDPEDLKQLIEGSAAIQQCLGGTKGVLEEEQVTIDFAYATAVAIEPIAAGEAFTKANTWVKRPGTGDILAEHFDALCTRKAARAIEKDTLIQWADVEGGKWIE